MVWQNLELRRGRRIMYPEVYQCRRCGRRHAARNCPELGRTCRRCGKGHVVRVQGDTWPFKPRVISRMRSRSYVVKKETGSVIPASVGNESRLVVPRRMRPMKRLTTRNQTSVIYQQAMWMEDLTKRNQSDVSCYKVIRVHQPGRLEDLRETEGDRSG
ncbi:hypothetical protein HPB52_018122 [Rhipicephalus sanguineus]|uniref:CCHC-type domain-containing protein n=1 Tax=Rhipicephalus sanguineus TaxID=34632 RepID=A0A9D4QEY4_RHISA|nr:hypothetical protein HPB52_018122 [Rhipicephalus sanguineus]